MARRPVRRLTYLLIALALVFTACQGGDPADITTSTTSSIEATTTFPEPTTTTTAATTTTSSTTTTVSDANPFPGTDVMIPDGEGKFPAVVLVHGGAWLVGNPASIQPLAIYLSENGFLTVNAPYQLSLQSPGFPDAIDDIACAVRYAASHPRSDGTVTVIGHSAGAQIAAVVAMNGDLYGSDCEYPGSGIPDQFVGLAGPYDISRLGPIMVAFFGSQPEDAPEEWDAGNPQLHVGDNLELESLILHGDLDQVVPVDFSENFYDGLIDSGGRADIMILEGVEHAGVKDPSIMGQILLDWLGR